MFICEYFAYVPQEQTKPIISYNLQTLNDGYIFRPKEQTERTHHTVWQLYIYVPRFDVNS